MQGFVTRNLRFVTRVRQVANKCNLSFISESSYICESRNTFVNRVKCICESWNTFLNRVTFICKSWNTFVNFSDVDVDVFHMCLCKGQSEWFPKRPLIVYHVLPPSATPFRASFSFVQCLSHKLFGHCNHNSKTKLYVICFTFIVGNKIAYECY